MWIAGLLIAGVGFYMVWRARQNESTEERRALTDGPAVGYLIAFGGLGLFIAAIR